MLFRNLVAQKLIISSYFQLFCINIAGSLFFRWQNWSLNHVGVMLTLCPLWTFWCCLRPAAASVSSEKQKMYFDCLWFFVTIYVDSFSSCFHQSCPDPHLHRLWWFRTKTLTLCSSDSRSVKRRRMRRREGRVHCTLNGKKKAKRLEWCLAARTKRR